MLTVLCCLFTVHTVILPFSMMSHRGGSKVVRNQDRDTDCIPDCASPSHAHIVLTSIALGNLGLVQHCSSLCSNVWRISDQLGRTPLHVAASQGHRLIARKWVAVDIPQTVNLVGQLFIAVSTMERLEQPSVLLRCGLYCYCCTLCATKHTMRITHSCVCVCVCVYTTAWFRTGSEG